ncbi:MAG: carboxypeptidase-like regulatory domain-containing protein [Myxococcaceae bacterium]
MFFTLLCAASLRAQSQGLGTLIGTAVDDTTNAPLSGVLVTATSPQLLGEQAVKSDSTGSYQIPQLPPGIYTIVFELAGYSPYVQRGIAVDADRTLRMNVELRSERRSTHEQ